MGVHSRIPPVMLRSNTDTVKGATIRQRKALLAALTVCVAAFMVRCDNALNDPDGRDWVEISPIFSGALSVCGCKDGRVIVCTTAGTYITADHGTTASVTIDQPYDVYIAEYAQTANTTIYGRSVYGGLFRLVERDKYWKPVKLPTGGVNAIYSYNNTLYCACYNLLDTADAPGLYSTKDHGGTFEVLGEGVIYARYSIHAIWKNSDGRVYVGTDSGLFVSDEQERRWRKMQELKSDEWPTNIEIYAIAGDGQGTIYAGGSWMFRSLDNGTHWEKMQMNYVGNMSALPNGYVVMISGNGVVYSYNRLESRISKYLVSYKESVGRAVAIDSAGYVYAAFLYSRTFRSSKPVK
jgi:hypothetical protein